MRVLRTAGLATLMALVAGVVVLRRREGRPRTALENGKWEMEKEEVARQSER
jgi:hypothetical protein